jgi:hypothetical protein
MCDDPRSFIQLCLEDDARPDEIDDYVDRWHDGEGDGSLAAFLGMTDAEYARWAEDPGSLDAILEARKESLSETHW